MGAPGSSRRCRSRPGRDRPAAACRSRSRGHRGRRVSQGLRRRPATWDVLPVAVEVEHRPAVGDAVHHGDVRVRLEAVELVGVHARDVVEFAALEGLDHRGRRRVELEDDFVRRALRSPVVRVPYEAGVLPGRPLDRLVRPAADDRRVVGEGRDRLERLVLPDVLGQDGMYIWRIRSDGSVLVTTRVVASGASTFVTPALARSGSGTRGPRNSRRSRRPARTGASSEHPRRWRACRPTTVMPSWILNVQVNVPSAFSVLSHDSAKPGRRPQVLIEPDEQVVVEGERLVPGRERRVPWVHQIEVLDGPDPQDQVIVCGAGGRCGRQDGRDGQAAAARMRDERATKVLMASHSATGGASAPKTTRDMRLASPPPSPACVDSSDGRYGRASQWGAAGDRPSA